MALDVALNVSRRRLIAGPLLLQLSVLVDAWLSMLLNGLCLQGWRNLDLIVLR